MKYLRSLGIIGGGQLGRMLAFEAKKLGLTVRVIDPTPDSPAGQVVDEQIVGGYSDEIATNKLARVSDFITVEIEHINVDTLHLLEKKGMMINPSSQTISIIKDKYLQKVYLRKNKIQIANFMEVTTKNDILDAGKKFGFPMLIKAKKDAFDGRGNALVKSKNDIDVALKKLSGRELYVEKFIPFIKELAVVEARSIKGDIVQYPPVETIHKNNICHIVKVPAEIDEKTKRRAQKIARRVLLHLKGAGVFTVELFLTHDGQILVNEIAPRVHNSGHLTIEASVTNQFEQHIRAVTGLPLGSTEMKVKAAVMINILGERNGEIAISGLDKVLQIKGVHVHMYGKKETKIDRKMGHITVIDQSVKKALIKAKKARKLLTV